MDEIKDISKKGQPSRFFDATPIRTKAFGQNTLGEQLYQRAERIVAAIHLLTNHVPQSEPIRTTLRSAGVELLSVLLGMRDDMRVPESQSFKNVESTIRKLISLSRLLVVSGYVSGQNSAVLVGALDDLALSLNASHKTALSENTPLNKEDLFVVAEAVRTQPLSDTSDKRQTVQIVKDKVQQRISTPRKKRAIGDRAAEITGVLGTQGKLGIKDIAASLPAYSEKMIQRELKDLVAGGRVKKFGSKRWSTYALAQ